jgi:hypothetical protein
MATASGHSFNVGPYGKNAKQNSLKPVRQFKANMAGPGSHVGFPITAKNNNLVYDHQMNISAKFGSNLLCGFRKKR